jgi:hypothetical protein
MLIMNTSKQDYGILYVNGGNYVELSNVTMKNNSAEVIINILFPKDLLS